MSNTARKIIVSLFILLLFKTICPAQSLSYTDTDNNLGFNVGFNLAFGTHFQRLGLNFNLIFVKDHFQVNSGLRLYYSFKNLGPKMIYPELVLSQGLVYAYGREKEWGNPFFNSVSNQTIYRNAFAYSYNAYFNRRKTTQQTGIIAIHVEQFSLITENDILGHTYYDRFRTAAFLVQYQYRDEWQAALNCSMWTGQYSKRIESSNSKFYTGCYMDTTSGTYTQFSHGLLSAQFKYYAGNRQNVQANLGVDAEQIRNLMQNKFIHDMRFIPKKWNKAKNCHIPMLDENGAPYLYEQDQKIRRAKLYLNLFSNANLFY